MSYHLLRFNLCLVFDLLVWKYITLSEFELQRYWRFYVLMLIFMLSYVLYNTNIIFHLFKWYVCKHILSYYRLRGGQLPQWSSRCQYFHRTQHSMFRSHWKLEPSKWSGMHPLHCCQLLRNQTGDIGWPLSNKINEKKRKPP